MPTPDDLAARTARATTAAAAAGRGLGLTVTDPVVLYDVFSVVVRLDPSPVVVRVPTVLPPGLTAEAQHAQQARELAVTGWLAGQGFPVVPPAHPDPVRRDGLSMTFWQLVDVVPAEAATGDAGRGIAALHRALADCPVDLPFMVPLDESIPTMLAELATRPDLLDPTDLGRARREWAALSPLADEQAFAARFPRAVVQPIHGDAPSYNVLHTPDGPLAGDFEHVGRGPVEWDLTFLGEEELAAYGAPVDPDLLATMAAARTLQLVAVHALVPQLPMLAEGMRPMLDAWRSGSEFTGRGDEPTPR